MRKSRREIIGTLAASGAVLAASSAARGNPVAINLSDIKKENDIACLYHCDFGDPQRFSQMLQNILNHYSAYEFDTFKLKLVPSGVATVAELQAKGFAYIKTG